jgi:hypothetical protein
MHHTQQLLATEKGKSVTATESGLFREKQFFIHAVFEDKLKTDKWLLLVNNYKPHVILSVSTKSLQSMHQAPQRHSFLEIHFSNTSLVHGIPVTGAAHHTQAFYIREYKSASMRNLSLKMFFRNRIFGCCRIRVADHLPCQASWATRSSHLVSLLLDLNRI